MLSETVRFWAFDILYVNPVVSKYILTNTTIQAYYYEKRVSRRLQQNLKNQFSVAICFSQLYFIVFFYVRPNLVDVHEMGCRNFLIVN